MLVTSRRAELEINDKKTPTFIPLADMINHSEEPNCHMNYIDNEKGFKVVAKKRIA